MTPRKLKGFQSVFLLHQSSTILLSSFFLLLDFCLFLLFFFLYRLIPIPHLTHSPLPPLYPLPLPSLPPYFIRLPFFAPTTIILPRRSIYAHEYNTFASYFCLFVRLSAHLSVMPTIKSYPPHTLVFLSVHLTVMPTCKHISS